MYKSVFLAALLISASFSAFASPRTLLPAESKIEFTVKEMGVPVTGVFKRFKAEIDIDPARLEQSSAVLTIEIGSLDTGSEEADAIAVDVDWLDKAHAPLATFRSQSIRALGSDRFESRGTLSIRNKARDVAVQFSRVDQPSGKTVFTGNFVIKRSEFGIGGGEWNQGGVVSEEIPVKAVLTLAPAAAAPAAKPAKPAGKK